MGRVLCLTLLLLVGGCVPVVMIPGIVSAAFTVAKDVVGIDISLRQNDPTKTPVATVLAPVTP